MSDFDFPAASWILGVHMHRSFLGLSDGLRHHVHGEEGDGMGRRVASARHKFGATGAIACPRRGRGRATGARLHHTAVAFGGRARGAKGAFAPPPPLLYENSWVYAYSMWKMHCASVLFINEVWDQLISCRSLFSETIELSIVSLSFYPWYFMSLISWLKDIEALGLRWDFPWDLIFCIIFQISIM